MCPCSSVYGSYLSIVEIIITVNAVSCYNVTSYKYTVPGILSFVKNGGVQRANPNPACKNKQRARAPPCGVIKMYLYCSAVYGRMVYVVCMGVPGVQYGCMCTVLYVCV